MTYIKELKWIGRDLWQLVHDDGSTEEQWKLVPGKTYCGIGRPTIWRDKLKDADWSLNDQELAIRYGTSPQIITRWRRALTDTKSPGQRSKYIGNQIDWENRPDALLAKELGITRERVRQIRMQFGKPCKLKHVQTRHVADLLWLMNHQQELDGLPLKEIVRKMPSELPIYTLKRLVIKAGIRYSNCSVPRLKMNYLLPNCLLSKIWGLPTYRIATFRYISRHGPPIVKWSPSHKQASFGPELMLPDIDAFITDEIKAAKESGCTVNENEVWDTLRHYREKTAKRFNLKMP